jgi:hypothetical protein
MKSMAICQSADSWSKSGITNSRIALGLYSKNPSDVPIFLKTCFQSMSQME